MSKSEWLQHPETKNILDERATLFVIVARPLGWFNWLNLFFTSSSTC